MKTYIGTKIIKGEPMDELTFAYKIRPSNDVTEIDKDGKSREGYHVIYPNPTGPYHSWSPKDVFENAYREISKSELKFIVKGNRI